MPDAPEETPGACGATRYTIRVREQLAETWAEWFDGFEFTYSESGATVLAGPVADQAALHGLLAKVRDLNLTLISLTREAPSQRGSHENSIDKNAS